MVFTTMHIGFSLDPNPSACVCRFLDFASPPYEISSIDHGNVLQMQGVSHGTFFSFFFVAPVVPGNYAIDCLAYKDDSTNTFSFAQDSITVGLFI